MLLSILGTPSDLTAALTRCVQTLIEVTHGAYHWIAVGTEDDLKGAWVQKGDRPALIWADIPAVGITRLLADSGAPIVVALESPASTVRSLAATRDLTGLPALRLASQSLATLHDVALAHRTWRIGPEAAEYALGPLLQELAAHYGLALDAAALDRALARLDARGGAASPLAGLMRLSGDKKDARDDMQLASRCLSGFDDLLAGRPVTRFSWGPEVFLGDKPHGAVLRGAIDLIGGRRCIIFGPLFHLPLGRWQSSIDFEIFENRSGNLLKIDIFDDRIRWEGTARLPVAGRMKCQVPIEVEEPRLPVQIRLFIDEGAIEGRLELHGVEVVRTA